MPARTMHEEFTSTFDVFPMQAPATQSTLRPATQASTFAAGVNGFEYGFGSATRRFQNEVYPQHLPYGLANKAVIELGRTQPVPVTDPLLDSAPSMMLPEFASRYEPEPGRAFSYGPDRKHPPAPDGRELFWVQPKDNQPPMDNLEAPEIFAVPAPMGTGPIERLHEQPTELMAPVHRREALVFDKCQQRARHELRKAANDAVRMARLGKTQFPNGLLGVEGPLAEQSLLYEHVRTAARAEQFKKEDHARRRCENLRCKQNTQLPYKLLTHDSQQSAPHLKEERRIFQGKKQVDHRAPAPGPFERAAGLQSVSKNRGHMSSFTLSGNDFEVRPASVCAGDLKKEGGFRSNAEKPLKPHNPHRAQRLHDVNAAGRTYDVISGMRTTVAPSSADYRPMDELADRKLHPSNLSLPRQIGTAPTLTAVPVSHEISWKPASPPRSPSKRFLG